MGEGRRAVLEHAASRAQRRLWFVEQLAPGEPLHNINVELRLAGEVDLPAFTAAVCDLVDRHEALRTVFTASGSELRQVVYSHLAATPVRFTDCTADPDPARGWESIRSAEANQPFDLERGPLLRTHLVRLAERDHRLALVVHHAVSDAWSVGVMISDLLASYVARRSGRAPDRPPPAVQYADFTAWQEQRLASGEADADLAYWRDQLADLPTVDLTRGRPRPAEVSHRGGRIAVSLPPAVVHRLGTLAAAENASPFMAFTALWAHAVGRWFGSRDVPLGTPVAGRPLAELADVVGLFVDRLVLRMDTGGNPSLRDLVRRARGVVLDAHEHASVTFEQVVDAIAPQRQLGVTPLFQVGINLVPPGAHVSAGLSEVAVEVTDGGQYSNGTVRHDLNLDLSGVADMLIGFVEYRADVLSEADAQGVTALLERLLDQATREPDRPLHRIPALLDPAGAAGAVRTGGPGGDPAVRVDEQVAAVARVTPEAPAVVAPGARLSYAELVGHAHTLAHTLAGRGVGPETTVLLAMPRRAELVVGLLGVLAAGAAYVPVDPAAPAAHLAAVARDSGATLALLLPGSPVALPAGLERVELRLAPTAPADPGPPRHAGRPDHAAYVLFTSGSTGSPKGVVVEHRQLAGYLHAAHRLLDPSPGASYLMVQPPTFDSCATQIYGALTTGGTLHLVDQDTARDPDRLGRYCADHPVDYLKIAPSHLAALLAGGERRLVPRRALVLGGEGCGRRFTRDLAAAGWRILVHYGPTETTVGVLGGPLTDQTGGTCPTTPLGAPFAGVGAYVLDEHLDPVPAGCPGELFVGGDLVARGYASRPGQTAGVFLPDPFADRAGARMYRTGDVVRALPDGGYEFCGRADRQVKVAGQRVELGAVEAVLERDHAVRRAVVVPRGAGLVGYVVLERGPGVTGDTGELAAALRDRVAGALPAYCVPAAVVVLDELPRTAHGKLDLRALPDPAVAEPPRSVPPTSPAEVALAAIWRQVLERDEVGVTDRFFDHGGDSIRVIEVVAQARRAGLALTARDVFEHQTIRELAAGLTASGTGPAEAARAVQAAAGGLDGLGGGVALPGSLPEVTRALAERGVTTPEGADLAALDPPALTVRAGSDGGPLLVADPRWCGDRLLAVSAWAAVSRHPASADTPIPSAHVDEPPSAEHWRELLAGAPPLLPALTPPGGGADAGAPTTARHHLAADTVTALAGPAHLAYGTTTGDLLVAATALALVERTGQPSVGLLAADPAALAGTGWADGAGPQRGPAAPVVVRTAADPAGTLRAARTAVRAALAGAPSWAAARTDGELGDVALPDVVVRVLDLPPEARFLPAGRRLTVTLAGAEVVVHGVGPTGWLAAAVADGLAALCEHCVGHREVYTAEDFPDAGLDADQLGRLFANLGVDGVDQ